MSAYRRAAPPSSPRVFRVRRWALWSLPPLLQIYIAATAGAAAVAFGALVSTTVLRWDELAVFVLLVGCAALSVESMKRMGEPAGAISRDLLPAWWLPIAFLLPPVYSLLAPIPVVLLTQWRVRRSLVHRRVFTAAATGLVNAAASWIFHTLTTAWGVDHLSRGMTALTWVAAAIVSAVFIAVVGTLVVAMAVKADSPEMTWRSVFWSRSEVVLDVGEQSTGVVMAVICALNPLLAFVGLVPVVLLQRSLMHDQLSAAARLDSKTGLLNAPTWEREAASEIARAVRTGTPLSILLLDIDHFKQVNDRYGHLAGDEMLRSVSTVMRAQVREYDKCGRFGGDEFAILLPQSDALEATRTAERIRRHVAALAVSVGSGEISSTVSIGVAELSSARQDVTELLAAADLSLYRAKASGRHRVHTWRDPVGPDTGG
jgi:diguanylate cyclase (GGDEF)-like protein